MKNATTLLLSSTLLFATSTALRADDDGNGLKGYLSGGYNISQGDSNELTRTPWGGFGAYTLEVGLEFLNPYAGVKFRPNLGYARILGDPQENITVYDLFGIYVGMDVVFSPFKNVSLYTGPSFHFWSVEDVAPVLNADPRQGTREIKFGWRVGGGYDIKPNIRVELSYTATEWRSNSDLDWRPGLNPSRPGYFTIKGTYTF